jgi:hypothetical protein
MVVWGLCGAGGRFYKINFIYAALQQFHYNRCFLGLQAMRALFLTYL